ncbi:MAG: DUF1572 family protein [Gemmatimonadetes bacterium]|nr:DUF1572 family protein [Gemmatimonadota bacterium]
MPSVISALTGEYTRYKALADGALAQLTDAELVVTPPGGGNSIATICWHVGGNLRSRFTEFLTTDGEKPWRQREEEFARRTVTHAELRAHWDGGWAVLFATLATLDDGQLAEVVTIRRQPLRVDEALMRSLAHVSYHVGQVVYAARAIKGDQWRFLSIPPGQSDAYNANPGTEKPEAHAALARGATPRA